ncbi:MAG: LacI family transcriptional regulator [Chloroflexi bacterium]|nr:LacI family transcriptional regulator [Chloroflexota bacterium]MCC6892288.1 LacI family DNA-binding transcriptional regulator [Anaerolineae bacterium]
MPSRKQRNPTPNILEVAKQAGVSPATVSRVLNNYPHIRDEVRAKVLEAIAQLGYEPNRVAQRLRATQSHLIGMIVTDITNPFFSTIMASIENVFFTKGYSLMMSNTASDPTKERAYLSMMENEGVAGLVIATTSENVDEVANLADKGVPIVVIDRRMTNGAVDMVLSDNIAGARSAVEHLISLGHERIGHIGGPLRLTSGRERYQGYQQAMAEARLIPEESWVRFGDHRHQSGYEQTWQVLEDNPTLTALFIENNMMTLGALNAIHDYGKRIPEDIAVVGFDDMPWAVSLNPPLTTVAQATYDIGTRVATRLLERIEEPDLPTRTDVVPTTLIVRASCGAKQRLSS